MRTTVDATRRNVLKAAAAASAAMVLPAVHAAGDELIKIGLVGCGGRGRGAVANALEADANTQLWAVGDLFPDAMEAALKVWEDRPKEKYNVPAERCFVGWDAYRKVIDSGAQYIILATPPGFRPAMVKAAIEAGKHVFAEKPVATCPAGVRMILEAAELASQKSLGFGAGLQRRHQNSYIETIKKLHDGELGRLLGGYGYWTQGSLWMKPREPNWSDMEWQVRNWMYFTWLSGDCVVEQTIHQIDIMNWAMNAHPKFAIAIGGRQVRTDPAYGHIYDHFAIDYEYPDGQRVTIMSRQMDNTYGRIGELVLAAKGTAVPQGRIKPFGGEEWRFRGEANNPLVQEHKDLLSSVRAGKPLNIGPRIAETTLTAIMGRMAAYTGQLVSYDFALKSKLDLTPRTLAFGEAPLPPVAMPGKDPLV